MAETPPLPLARPRTVGLGMITPSANTVVERVTIGVLAAFPDVAAHFTRIPVSGSSDDYPADYDWPTMLAAARLLTDAKPAALCWNGSRGGSFGFDVDRRLCDRIAGACGLPCTTATLAIEAALRRAGARRIGLVTPYRPQYIAKLVAGFGAAGFEVVAEAHAGLDDNLSYASLADDAVAGMVRAVARHAADAIVTFCTNLPAAHLTAAFEAETGRPVFDSTSAAVWDALRLAGQDTAPGHAWGSLFEARG